MESIAMKKLLFAVLVLTGLATSAQNKVVQDPNAKPRAINGSFTGVSVSSGVELFLSQGNETSLAVSVSDEKYAERLKTEVEDGVLKIYFDNKGFTWNKGNKDRKLKAYLSVKTLEKLAGSGGSMLHIINTLNVGNFELKMSSGSMFKGAIKAADMSIRESSGASITLSGAASKVDIEVNSGAIFHGYDFVSETCNAQASSGAEINITINRELVAKANSGAGIHYRGSAVVKDMQVSSGGIVKKS